MTAPDLELSDAECDAIAVNTPYFGNEVAFNRALVRAGAAARAVPREPTDAECDAIRATLRERSPGFMSYPSKWERTLIRAGAAARAVPREPVAWRIEGSTHQGGDGIGFWTSSADEAAKYSRDRKDGYVWRVQPLYAATERAAGEGEPNEPPMRG